jgi:phage I-like protein
MPNTTTHLHLVLPPSASTVEGGVEPSWIQLVPAGRFEGRDGRGPFYLTDPQAVVRDSLMYADRLPIDENHSIDLAAPYGQPSPAVGWIVELEARADGIWGRVEWTARGRQLVDDRAYRGISPALLTEDDTGRVLQVLRASLTNNPNLDLATLHAKQESTMDLAALRKALGLADTADEAAILTAVTTTATSLHQARADLDRIAKAAGGAKPDDVVARLDLMARTGDPAALSRQVVELQAQIKTLTDGAARQAAEADVDAAIAAGKPITPAMRDWYVGLHMADPAGTKKALDQMISLNGAGRAGRKPPEGGDGPALSDADTQVAKLLGVDPAAMAKTRAADRAHQETL